MRKIIGFLVVVILCLGISGCTSSKTITLQEAQTYALKEVEGTVDDYTQNLDDDTPNYLFAIIKDDKRYVVKIHGETGEVISNTLDTEYVVNQTTTIITSKEAEEIAFGAVGGGTVEKSELLSDERNTQYEVQIYHNSKDYVVKVNAISKEVIDIMEYEID